ncbi:MAG TPA: hypothetical protein VGP99_09465 [Tepidisphaeraceae bacterium]|nr:hypothetical protein [Tepidisphaeraceae bacterium]
MSAAHFWPSRPGGPQASPSAGEQPVGIFVNYFSSDFKWICIVLGAIMILAGTFGSAPHSEE